MIKKKSRKTSKSKELKSIAQKKPLLFDLLNNSKYEKFFPFIPLIISLVIGFYYVYYQYSKNGFFGFPLDDPWIHLTFAKNLVEYGAYSFYKNEVITSGSTSPLYTFLAAIIFLLLKNEFILSYIIGIVSFGVLSFFSYKLAKVESTSSLFALIFSLLIAFQPKLGLISVSGMETTLFIFLLVLSFYLYRKQKFLELSFALGLTLWARPEGIILIITILLDYLAQNVFHYNEKAKLKKKDLVLFILPLSLIIIGYFIFNFVLSGFIFPNTYAAKINYYYGSNRENFLKNDVLNYFSSGEFSLIAIIFIISSIVLLIDIVKKKYNSNFVYFLFVIGFILAYYIQLPFSHRFGRYLMPIIPSYLLIVLLGLKIFLYKLHQKGKTDWSRIINIIFSVIIVFVLYKSFLLIPDNRNKLVITSRYHYDRHIKVAEWIRNNTPPDAIIATHDIGALSFYSNRKIIDMVGLVNLEVIDHLNDKNFSDFMKNYFIEKGVSYFAVFRNWFEVVNQAPVYIPINEYEYFEVFKFDPTRFHIMPREASFYNQKAMNFIKNKNYRAALELLNRSLILDPNSTRTLFLIGTIHDLLNNFKEAEKYFTKALELFPEYPEALYEIARLKYIENDVQSAKTYVSKLLEVDPASEFGLKFMITILEKDEKNFEESQKYREMLEKVNANK